MIELIVLGLALSPFLAVGGLLIEAIRGRGTNDSAWMDLIRA